MRVSLQNVLLYRKKVNKYVDNLQFEVAVFKLAASNVK